VSRRVPIPVVVGGVGPKDPNVEHRAPWLTQGVALCGLEWTHEEPPYKGRATVMCEVCMAKAAEETTT
jgi:hypothetical protein